MSETNVQYDVDPELLTNFLDESEESIATLDSSFIQLEQQPKDKEIIGSIFRIAHSIKGLAGFLNLRPIRELTHELETVLDNIRQDKLTADSEVIDILLEGFDELSQMLERVRTGKSQVQNKNCKIKINCRNYSAGLSNYQIRISTAKTGIFQWYSMMSPAMPKKFHNRPKS